MSTEGSHALQSPAHTKAERRGPSRVTANENRGSLPNDRNGGSCNEAFAPSSIRKDRMRPQQRHERSLLSKQWLELRQWQTSLERPAHFSRRYPGVKPNDSLSDSSDSWSSATTVVDCGDDCGSSHLTGRGGARSGVVRTRSSGRLEAVCESPLGAMPPIRRARSAHTVRWPDEEEADGKLTYELLYRNFPEPKPGPQAENDTLTDSESGSMGVCGRAGGKKGRGSGVLGSLLGTVMRSFAFRSLSPSGTKSRRR